MTSPSSVVGVWLRGLLAFFIVIGALYSGWRWYDQLPREQQIVTTNDGRSVIESRPLRGPIERITAWKPGADETTLTFAMALALALWAAGGRLFGVRLRRPRGNDEPHAARTGRAERLIRPDGSEINVETYGPPDGQPIVLIHGWGCNSSVWYYAKRQLADRFRLIVWDLRGIAPSTGPSNADFGLVSMAGDLQAVLDASGDRPAFVVGHSIGGMIIMTHSRVFSETLARDVAGIVIVQSTYTNPVRTTQGGALLFALQDVVLRPLLRLTIWLSPVVWVMNWLSYWNGSAHSSTERSSFAGTETRGQLDLAARFQAIVSPAVLARGQLAMLEYEATRIDGPVPALVVVGDQDPVTKPEAGLQLAELTNGEVAALSPAKHLGLLERNSRLNEIIAGFCMSTLERASARRSSA